MGRGRGGSFGGGRGGGLGRGGGFGGGGSRLGGSGRGGSSFGNTRPAGRGSGLNTPRPAARPVAPRRNPGFGAGMAVGMGMRRRRGWGWGGPMWGPRWGWGRRRHTTVVVNGGGGMNMQQGGGCGCGTFILGALVLVFIAVLLFNFGAVPQQVQPVTRSTVERTALDRNAARTNTEMFTDHMHLINNRTNLLNGLNSFHNATGVRPHLYVVGRDDFPGAAGVALPQLFSHVAREMPAFAQSTYDRLFNDEAHLLLVFFEYDDGRDYVWYTYPLAGIAARQVMDQEAMDILQDYIGRYYYQFVQVDQIFGRAFADTGSRIMATQVNIWLILILVVGGVLVLFILFSWWKNKQEQKRLEAEETERILSQPLDTFGSSTSDAANDLADKYDE